MIPKEQAEIIKLIDESINKFMDGIPNTQKKSFDRLLELVKELDVSDGKISNNINNIKLLGKIRGEMDAIVLNKPYLKKVAEFAKAYNKVQSANKDYYATVNKRFTPPPVLNAVKKEFIETTVEQLTENGIAAKYTDAIKGILKTNITSGGSYADMIEQLKKTMIGSGDKDLGYLEKYAGQIVTDSINQYNRQYNKTVTDDLEFEWYAYSGTLIKTSRPFCVHLETRGFFHKSEVPGLLSGIIGDNSVELNENTGLPQGMIEGTNEDSFFVNAGGHRCNHVIYGVSEVVVPEGLKKEVLG